MYSHYALDNTQIKRQLDSSWRFLLDYRTLSVGIIAIILSYIFLDKSAALFFHAHKSPLTKTIFSYITELGSSTWYFIISITALVIAYRFKLQTLKHVAALILVCVLVSGLSVDLIKMLLGRARPKLLFTSDQFGFYFLQFKSVYWSFPSGHSATITAVGMLMALLYPRLKWIAAALVVMVIASRLILTAHYPSDVIAGAYIGAVSTLTMVHVWLSKCHPKLDRQLV